MSTSDSSQVRQHHARATGNTEHMGYGKAGVAKDSKVGYSKGGHVSKVHSAGHHNMDGHKMEHHHSHKTHGHHVGVHHHVTKGVPEEPHGAGGTKGAGKGPSSNQFGPGEPHGGSVGKW